MQKLFSSLLFSSLLFAVSDRAVAQLQPPQLRYSTHDGTLPGIPTPDFNEWWADAKSPGDGFIYLVGTIEVADSDSTPAVPLLFSGQPIYPPQISPTVPWTVFTYLPIIGGKRQIVALQIVDPAQQFDPLTQGIVQQRFFYGGGIDLPPFQTGSSNARGISVWPGATVQDTRIAICGESYDRNLPLSQAPTGAWLSANGGLAAGFIAVYDGEATLLWTHHFFTDRPNGTNPLGHSAITDVSIRVEFDTNGVPTNDIVTFCGVSSHGNPPGPADALTPVDPFIAPTGSGACNSPAGGATDNGGSQWDGIVGRLSRPHDGSGTTMPEFLAIVGGNRQDGLFGIAEIDEDRFVVVGSTGDSTGASTGFGVDTFPFTDGTCPASPPGSYAVGVAMIFDASGVVPGPGGALELRVCRAIGSLTGFTVARDVYVVPQWQAPYDGIYIVGSTSDLDMLNQTQVAFQFPQANIGGGVDGFLIHGVWDSGVPSSLGFNRGTFRGAAGDEVLTGVQGWREFADHVCVVGFAGPAGATDIETASYYVDTSGGAPQFIDLAAVVIGGTNADLPTAQGAERSTSAGAILGSLEFVEFGLGDPAGGGICVDETARVNVVGTTESFDFPVFPVGVSRDRQGALADGIRAAFDLIPDGVGRTDGTGTPPPMALGFPGYPLPGFFGGTTPDCALLPSGPQIGVVPAPNSLPRMLIDFEGTMGPGSTDATIVVVRPPNSATFQFAALHLDFPGAAPGGGPPYQPIVIQPEGLLLWTTNGAVANLVVGAQDATLRFPLSSSASPLPPSPLTVSAQLVCLLDTGAPVTAGVSPNCSGSSLLAASPALWFSY